MDFEVYRSLSHDPGANLNWEESLFDDLPENTVRVVFYINKDAVVMGKFQNPWRECNLSYCEAEGIPVFRRFSGGGTVYHDIGNLNFSFLGPKDWDPNWIFQEVDKLLKDKGVHLTRTERGDFLHDGKKVSGSAHAYKRNKQAHHGTLLINADLDRASKTLKGLKGRISTHAVQSCPSPIKNLSKLLSGQTAMSLCEEWADLFAKQWQTNIITVEPNEYGSATDPDRVYKKTPPFSYLYVNEEDSLSAEIDHGIIKSFIVKDNQSEKDWTEIIGKEWKRQVLVKANAPNPIRKRIAAWLAWERF
ncbi:lipoyl protein ligase domain-containing protein [Spirochaeta cellobiosiphila]|uniref:lipoyl protein ligase domain-containing protein n=1 Tax=Spirochaeta cellobiosiphila TaxID=504483 RepID=UPI0003F873C9|nr:hypothetical protein [Spirochaeta cellobiosiphila]